ncbi:LTA synthase family protein [Hymenobacter daeguensis]
MIPSPAIRLLLRRFALLMAVYTLLRFCFYCFNLVTFRGIGVGSVALAFGHGLRFDVAALLWLNLPLVLASLLVPVTARRGQQWLRALFVLLNIPGFLLNVIDFEYFKFIGRRLSNEWHTIGHDIAQQAGQIGLQYIYLLPPLLLLVYLLWRFSPMPTADELATPPGRRPWLQRSVEFALVVLGVVLGLRGGWQLKPLRTGTAFDLQPAVLGHLALNSTFTVLKSFDEVPVERVGYFPAAANLRAALGAPALPTRPPVPPDNVVVLLLESFGSEYTGVENGGQSVLTPFFDSLATAPNARFMRENYANGRRSIEALPAVLSGLPSLMDEPFITSSFQTAELHGLGEILGRHGYTTAMYHAGANGTMGFDMFSGIAGMQHYYGLNEYPGGAASPDYDGHWGIFDEPYLQYFNQRLTATRQPFLAAVFTLSSHEPFSLPARYKGKFLAGSSQPIHPTIAYADMALRRFFQAASREPWYANTLFVLTADHTSQSDRAGYQNPLGYHKTPLLLFRPGHPLPAVDAHRISEQVDVPASVLDVLGLAQEQKALLPFGSSVFETTSPGRAIFRDGDSYFLVHSDFVTELTNKNQIRLYPYKTHFIPNEPVANPDPALVRQYGTELRACVQFYVNGLLDNRLYK